MGIRHEHNGYRLIDLVVADDDKRSTRLNIISHILEQIPYKAIAREKVVLPKRQKRGNYVETKYPFRYIPQKY